MYVSVASVSHGWGAAPRALPSRPPRSGVGGWLGRQRLGEDDGVSQQWKDGGLGSSGFLGTVLRQGLGLEGAVALYSRRPPGKGSTKMADSGQPSRGWAWEEWTGLVRGDEPWYS